MIAPIEISILYILLAVQYLVEASIRCSRPLSARAFVLGESLQRFLLVLGDSLHDLLVEFVDQLSILIL